MNLAPKSIPSRLDRCVEAMLRDRFVRVACSVMVLLTGCSERGGSPLGKSAERGLSSGEIARVGGVVISRAAFEREWARRTEVRSKDALLEEMIRFETLLAKARAAGVERDPAIAAAIGRLLVGRFQEEELRRRGADSVILSEAEIDAYYQSHRDRYATPRQIRLGLLHCKGSSKATPEAKEALRQRAEALWRQARQADDRAFRQLVLEHSDDQITRYAGGDTGWFTPEPSGTRLEAEVLEAALALSRTGEVAPLVATGNGFYIVKLLGIQAADLRPLEQVRDGIKYQLRLERAEQLRQAFYQDMRAGLEIEINRASLDAIQDRGIQDQASAPPSLPK